MASQNHMGNHPLQIVFGSFCRFRKKEPGKILYGLCLAVKKVLVHSRIFLQLVPKSLLTSWRTGSKHHRHGHPLQILLKSCGFRPQNLQGSDFSREKSVPVVAVHAAGHDGNSNVPKPFHALHAFFDGLGYFFLPVSWWKVINAPKFSLPALWRRRAFRNRFWIR